jgi:hypothetical protein
MHGSGVSLIEEGNVGGSSPVTHPTDSCCSATNFKDSPLPVSE